MNRDSKNFPANYAVTMPSLCRYYAVAMPWRCPASKGHIKQGLAAGIPKKTCLEGHEN